ncbi:UvrD-helicase domain-containing protein [Candidatus Woesearchaeota archaeon]|nr:UvrD-helicase domain-containing protein [Candidatus Woesearchaeota archaeon]
MEKKELDYINILKALNEIPFGVGKKLLADFLSGKASNKSIQKNRLDKLSSFGSLAYSEDEIIQLIDSLTLNSLITLVSVPWNKFLKVLEISEKGRAEILNPQFYKKKLGFNYNHAKTEITEEDKKTFDAFGSFLSDYNDLQKKAIISKNSHMLCIAGAGSGKTTVLTKRIEFLVKYCSVDPKKILAITFTRKARQEMVSRVHSNGLEDVNIETFNSFCEKILRRNSQLVYDKEVRVLSYRDKVRIINNALEKLNTSMNRAISTYFSPQQMRSKTMEQLANVFANDCFFIRDYFKFKNNSIDKELFSEIDNKHITAANLMFGVCTYIDAYMKKHGLRDFADQLMDSIWLFENHKDKIPNYDYILVDEYQDVNSTQIKLLDILDAKNMFIVGDPRQSIFGWRGSDVSYILGFEEKYPDCEIITLTKNYRSSKPIVKLINESIKKMQLPDLDTVNDDKADLKLLNFSSEMEEFDYLINEIQASKLPLNEIFVLARTNRLLNDLSNLMKARNIKHIRRSDEMKASMNIIAKQDEITLATIHGIKGMEAELVFLIGATSQNFPCKGTEHPVVEMIKVNEYDKEEEERRLFYVGMSRAKKSLRITYSGSKPSYFITPEMTVMFNKDKLNLKKKLTNVSTSSSNNTNYPNLYKIQKTKSNNKDAEAIASLKEWRLELSRKYKIPAYRILTDRTIFDIVDKMPASIGELNSIHGLGMAKISKYGEDILLLIS